MRKVLILFQCLFLFIGSNGQQNTKISNAEIRIIKADEPGIPFTLDVWILDIETLQPLPGAEVFVYQTNHKGDYERDAKGVARINGTVQSDQNGKVRFLTIYPRGYNDSPTGEHMHFQVNKAGYKRAVADLNFADYYRKRYDFKNPFTYKVYLKTLEKNEGKYTGTAFIYLKKS